MYFSPNRVVQMPNASTSTIVHNELASNPVLDIELVAAPPAELYCSGKVLRMRECCGLHMSTPYLTVIPRMNHEISSRMDKMDGMAQLSGIIVI